MHNHIIYTWNELHRKWIAQTQKTSYSLKERDEQNRLEIKDQLRKKGWIR